MNYVIKMSASFRMLWVRVTGRWSIQGENKVCVFRRTFLFLTLGAGCRGGDKLGSSPWTWRGLSRDAARAQHLLPCCHSLARLSVAQCPQHCRQGPSAPLLWHCRDRRGLPSGHSCHLSGGRELLLPGLMAELGCLGLEWMWTRAVFQVCVSGFCYRFR